MKTSRIFLRGLFGFSLFILMALTSVLTIKAQSNNVDLSFNAVPSKAPTSTVRFLLQPDNKILIFGRTLIVNGIATGQIARFNADGTLDNSFNCQCTNAGDSAILQSDGKIVIAGSMFSVATNTSVSWIQRLNSDGSIDTSFISPFGAAVPQVNTAATVWDIQPDGKIIVSILRTQLGSRQYTIIRLNPNGTIDNTFTTIDLGTSMIIQRSLNKVAVTPEGKILIDVYVSSGSSSSFITRYNSDSSLDSTFETPSVSPSSGSSFSFDLQPDGKILIFGNFSSVNGISRKNIARLDPAGNVDLSFVPPDVYQVGEAVGRAMILANGKILFNTTPVIGFPPQVTTFKFYRLNSDGSLDNTFTSPNNIAVFGTWMEDSNGKILLSAGFLENGVTVYRFVRLNTDGSIDNTFNLNFDFPASISTLAVQPDNKVIVSGEFMRINGVSRSGFARLNSDGTTDTTFNSGNGFNNTVKEIAVQQDGKILVGGSFSNYNGTPRTGIARLNSDGSLDSAFNPQIGSNPVINVIKIQSDGKILIGGNFDTVNSAAHTDIVRLNSDGSLDASFNVTTGNGSINDIALQTDGKIIIGGTFSSVNGFNRSSIARLNSDGSVDSPFNASIGSAVRQIEVQSDGKILVLANFLSRLNSNGTTDSAYQQLQYGDIVEFVVLPDGSIIFGRNFSPTGSSVLTQSEIIKLKPDGSLVNGFVSIKINNILSTLKRQNDGKILIAGNFTIVDNVTRIGIARLNNNILAPRTMFDFDGDGRADLAVFRPSNGVWYLQQSTAGFSGISFGTSSDILTPADYNGDGKADLAVFRPSTGYWYTSTDPQQNYGAVLFGANGDLPVPADYDGDGKADIAVFRPSNGVWYIQQSQAGFVGIAFGQNGDKPVAADYDGDGRTDIAVFRPANGVWYIKFAQGVSSVAFGDGNDKPVPADYNGDGKADLAVFRPSTGYWYTSTDPQQNYGAVLFGASGDLPVPADYDGDGKADIAVFRPSNGVWYLNRSAQGFTGVLFGISEDKPIPNAFIR